MATVKKNTQRKQLPAILRLFLGEEAAGGRLILIAALAALAISNSTWHAGYEYFWHLHLSVGVGSWILTEDLRQWVSDGLMVVFFLVVGLEVKREVVTGELRTVKMAIVPIAAALGGMLAPALIFLLINGQQAGMHGWGIPMATDIAIAVGLLALLGRRIPAALKIFLLTLAIVDDIGAIIVIAVFYNQAINVIALAAAGAIAIGMLLLSRTKYLTLTVFTLLGIGLWLAVHASGVSASITGVILGFLAPLTPPNISHRSIAANLERTLLPVATFMVVPVFVFANAGLAFKVGVLQSWDGMAVAVGIIAGLVLGKVIGITGATWLVVQLRLGRLPAGITWSQLIGLGFLAGVGFTVSIFITQLAFTPESALIDAAKIGIFMGSLISAGLGLATLRLTFAERRNT